MKIICRETERVVRTSYRLDIDDDYAKRLSDYIRSQLVNPDDMPQNGFTPDEIVGYWQNYYNNIDEKPIKFKRFWADDSIEMRMTDFIFNCIEEDLWDSLYDDDTIDEDTISDEVIDC